MELVLGQQRLLEHGGSETYLLTVAAQLQRLGHEVTIFAVDVGQAADDALARGLRVAASPVELPASCDGVLVQDGVVSLLLADRYPKTAQLYIAHAPGIDLQRPVQLDGVVAAVVALNEHVATRLEGTANRYEIVRLRQPIDVQRFAPPSQPRSKPEVAVLVSNYFDRAESEALGRVCSGAGVKLERIGGREHGSAAPEIAMATADIVFGHGRSALEGMAMGRAVYVMHRWGRDGWVTSDSYRALEADGFAGQAYRRPLDDAQLARDLAEYRPEMGWENRRLVVQNHHALGHACELVALLRRLSASSGTAPAAPLREMARLVRLQWQTDERCVALTHEISALRAEIVRLHRQIEEAREETAAAAAEVEFIYTTRRYRLGALLARPLDALRAGRAQASSKASDRNASTSAPHTAEPKRARRRDLHPVCSRMPGRHASG